MTKNRTAVFFTGLLIVSFSFAVSSGRTGAGTQAERFDLITHVSSNSSTDVWEIRNPEVRKPRTDYKGISFRFGDKVSIAADGCVQTGGKGKTWKLYVSPRSDSPQLYHGLVGIPRPNVANFQLSKTVTNLVKIEDAIGKDWNIIDSKDEHENDVGFSYLVLGYEDDDYSDNGYWSHDDGTEDQCRNKGNAWVRITITHSSN